MASLVLPKHLRERLAALMAGAQGSAPITRLLAKIASHDAAVRMLAKSMEGGQEARVRQTLAEGAAFLHDLHSLAIAGEDEKPKEGEKPGEGRSKVPAPPQDTPARLRGAQRVKVFIDGGSKGNPGPAAIGVVFTNVKGETLHEISRRIGDATNNVAEYTALITALKALADSGVGEAFFFSDSELLVRQVTGVYKIKSPGLLPLAAEAQALRRRLSRFQIVHVPREQNRRADQLANLALSA